MFHIGTDAVRLDQLGTINQTGEIIGIVDHLGQVIQHFFAAAVTPALSRDGTLLS
jgi:hypothetical protein